MDIRKSCCLDCVPPSSRARSAQQKVSTKGVALQQHSGGRGRPGVRTLYFEKAGLGRAS